MRRRVAATTILFIAACAMLRPRDPDRRLHIEQTGTVFEASNGFQFAVLPEPTNVVRVDIRYPVGTAHDPPGKEGLAHLVEHLLFDIEYSQGGERTSINAELGRIAISWNAETHADYTVYQTLAAAEYLEEIIALEVNRLAVGCAGLTAEMVVREREVVLNELRERQGASGAQLMRTIYGALYPEGHPYRRVDSVDSVGKLELADVCQFIATQYGRGKAIVLVSGNVDEASVKRAAAKHFVRLRKRDQSPRSVPAQVNPPPGVERLRGDIDEPAMFLATWSLPPLGTREHRLLHLVWPSIAGDLETFAYMYKWGHSAFTRVLGGHHAPVLAVGIFLRSPGDAGQAREFLDKALRWSLEGLGAERDSPAWLGRLASRTQTLLARYESLSARNEMFGDFMMFGAPDGFVVGQLAELQQSSPDDVRALADKWIAARHARILLIEPSGSVAASSGGTYVGGREAHGTAVDGSLADKPAEAPVLVRGLRTERYELANGLSVILWPYGTSPLVRGRLVVAAGTGHDPPGAEGVSSLIGADTVEPEVVVFESRNLSTMVDVLIKRLAAELRYPGQPLSDDAKQYLKARLHKNRTQERLRYDRDVLAAVYGEQHPYARPSMTADSVDRIHHDLVNDWARDHVVPSNATLVIAGKFDAELVKQHIKHSVGHVKRGTPTKPVKRVLHSALPRFVGGTTTAPSPTIELGLYFRSVDGIDQDHAKRLLLEEVVASKISSLRGKHALSYGFSASFSPRKAGGLWTIKGEADARRAVEAATVLIEVLAEMRRDPESYRAAFVLARQKVLERLVVGDTDSYAIAERLAFMARFDLDDDFFASLVRKIAKLTLTDMHSFLARELRVGSQTFAAFGNADPVAAALAEARHAIGEQ